MSEINMSSDIPTHWKYVRLGEVSKIIPGNSPPSETYNTSGEGVPLINGPVEFGDGPFQKTKRVKFTTEPTKECKRDDLLLCVRGSTTGRMNISGFDACIGRGVAAIRAVDKVDQSFLNYYVHFKQQHIFELGSGSTFPSVSKNDVSEIPIPLPSLDEQRDIVAKIEELFSNLDAGVDGLQAAQKQLERYRLSVLQAAVEGRLTAQWRQENPDIEPADKLLERILEERRKQWEEHYRWSRYDSKDKEPPSGWKSRYKDRDEAKLPESAIQIPKTWDWISADQIGRVETGSTPKTSVDEYYDGEHPFYRPGDLDSGIHTRTAERTLTEKGLKEARPLPEGSTLITCIGATIGKVGLIHRRGASNQQINAIIPVPSVESKYIFYVVESPFFQTLIKTRASATTMPILNKGRTKKLPIPLPPHEEQKEIVTEIERLFSVTDDAVNTVDNESRRADRLRQSILKQAFNGKLVPHSEADGEVVGDASLSGDGLPTEAGTQAEMDL